MADGSGGTIESASQFKANPRDLQRRWSIELAAAEDAKKRWHDQAVKAVKQYVDEKIDGDGPKSRLNLYHANTNIVLAIIFGQMPKVDVSRRFADSNDEEARVSSEMLERYLNSDIEDEADDFENEARDALFDWKTAGLGQIRLRYDADFEAVPGKPAMLDDEGNELAPEVPDSEEKTEERIKTDYVFWDDFLWSPCRRWKDVRWVAFKNEMSRDEARKRFNKPVGKKGQTIGDLIPLDERGAKKGTGDFDQVKEAWSRAIVWEIWDKDTRKVYWFSKGFDRILDVKSDPLGLKAFFPCPRPLMSNLTTTKLVPKPDFELDRNLYDEINELTDRIRRLERMAKVAGAYDKTFPDLARITEETNEGQLIPVSKWAALAEKGGLKGVMDFLPIDGIIKGIEVLSAKRVEKIQLLDQIIGLSAAIRGQADPNSTATANRIEAGFASTRLETDKDEVARFMSDLQKLRAEIISKHCDAETIVARSNALRMEIDPASGEPNLDLINRAVELIRSDVWQYRIEVKSDSVALRDYASMKQERVETIGALAGLFQQSIPMVQLFPQAAPFVLEVGKWLMAATKGSQQIEGVFDKFAAQAEQAAMAPKPPAPPDPKLQAAQVKAQAEGTKAKMGVVQTMVDAKAHMQKTAMDMQTAREQHGMDMQKMAQQQQNDAARAAAQIVAPHSTGVPNA